MQRLLSLFICVSLILGCEKAKEDAKTLLTARSWKHPTFEQQRVLNGIAGPWELVVDTVAKCREDDLFTFALDGSLLETEGPTKCSFSQSDTVYTGSWILLSNDTELELKVDNPGTSPITLFYDIDKLDEKILQVSRKDYRFDSTGTNTKDYYIYRFTHAH